MPERMLIKKLAKIMASVEEIPKRGYNAHFDYHYPLEADVLTLVRPLLAKENVMLLPSVPTTTREGKLTTIGMVFSFHDGDTGETLDVQWAGQGDDSSDKGIWKAITGSVKYFLLKTFLIPTGDDPESTTPEGRRTNRPEKPTRPPAPRKPPVLDNVARDPADARLITAAEADRLRKLLQTHQIDPKAFKNELKTKFGYKSADDIERKNYDVITRAVTEGAPL